MHDMEISATENSFTAEHAKSGIRRGLTPRLPQLAAAAALVAAACGLAGCGNSTSGKADTAAIYASQDAAGLTVSAGDYRPAASFPVALHSPLSPEALQQAESRAKQSPAAYLAPRSSMRDLRHASAMLASLISQGGLRHNFKSLLESQKGQVELLASQQRINKLSAALLELTTRFNTITQDSALLNSDRLKTAELRTEYKIYAVMHKNALRRAVHARVVARRRLAVAHKQVARLASRLAAAKSRRDALNSAGMALVVKSHNSTGSVSLNEYKQAMGKMDQAAGVSQKIELIAAHLAQAKAHENLVAMQAAAAGRHAVELAAARKTAASVAAKALRRIAAIQAGARAVIIGSANNRGVPSVGDQFTVVAAQLKIALHQADAAIALSNQARQDLKQASFEQSKNSIYASQLATRGLRPNDPLILANEDHNLQSLFNLQAAIASINTATACQMKLQILKLQGLCAKAGDSIYPLINQTAPVAAPSPTDLASCGAAAVTALNNATDDANLALNPAPSGRSPVKWLAPAVTYQANLALAEVTPNLTLKKKYREAANAEAQKANQLNPFLRLATVK